MTPDQHKEVVKNMSGHEAGTTVLTVTTNGSSQQLNIVSQNIQGPYAVRLSNGAYIGFDLPQWPKSTEELVAYTGMSEALFESLLKSLQIKTLKNASTLHKQRANKEIQTLLSGVVQLGIGDFLGECKDRQSIETYCLIKTE